MPAIAYTGTKVGFAVAAANYSSATNQYRVVNLTTAATPTFELSTAGAATVIGVLQDTPGSGIAGSIQIDGISRVRVMTTAHAAIIPGTPLRCSTEGGLGGVENALVAASTGDYVIGRSLEILAANTTGIIGMHITHQGDRGSTA